MGYENNVVSNGYSLVTPAFKAVGATTYDIQDYKVIGAKKDGDVTLQVFNAEGRNAATYYWLNEYKPGSGDDGWYNNPGGQKLISKSFTAGEAGYLLTHYEGVALRSSGEVATSFTADLNNGYTLIGNSTPVAIHCSKIKVIGAKKDGDVTIQFFNTEGRNKVTYYWLNEYKPGSGDDGWYNNPGGQKLVDFTLQPGESVYAHVSYTGATLSFNGDEIK